MSCDSGWGVSRARPDLLDHFNAIDIAVQVVVVGGVGTRCLIVLFVGRDGLDPLFLWVKQAGPSALGEYPQPSQYDNQGRRVVEGQRLVQAQPDVFLCWTGAREDAVRRPTVARLDGLRRRPTLAIRA